MLISPHDYIKLITYQIVHYLAMVSNIYIKRIKIKWVANDIGQHYIQQILDYQTKETADRLIKFRLPIAK